MMGSRIAQRLMNAGYRVTGYNRTRSKVQGLVQNGMRLAESPRAVAETSEITLSMVTGTHALAAIANGTEGLLAGLAPGKIWVDMSTVSPHLIRELAARSAAKGAPMLEAPVSGSIPAAQSGTLVAFVGGDAGALERVRPVLEILAQKIVHVGANGQGMALKIAINANLASQLVTFFETLLLAEKNGIPRAQAMDAMLNSVIASPLLKYRAPLIQAMPAEVWFSVEMMQKDHLLALELGRELGMALPTVSYANELLTAARGMGYGAQDFAALFYVVERMSGATESVAPKAGA